MNEIISKWKKHYSTLLNAPDPADPRCPDALPPFLPIQELNQPSTMQEVSDAKTNLLNKKIPAEDDNPAELLKNGGLTLHAELNQLILLMRSGRATYAIGCMLYPKVMYALQCNVHISERYRKKND